MHYYSLCEGITQNETFISLKSQTNHCHLSWLGGRTLEKVCVLQEEHSNQRQPQHYQ